MAAPNAILDRLKDLHPRLIDLSLERVHRLMDDLGNPERRLPPVIHVAGTKGKGSTVATLRAVLEAGGYRVHAYTSPHLVRFNERIRLAGHLIDDAALTACLEEVERVNASQPITLFEVTTAAALLAFARAPADVLLLEVGLGGRLDATNVVARPLASVLTPISIDHIQFLGDTIPKIAFEKAGIIKAGAPAVIGVQPPEASAVFESRAAELGATLFRRGVEWRIEAHAAGLTYRGKRTFGLPLPNLPGAHQIDNAVLAVATLDCIDAFTISDDQFRTGLRRIDWPARLQRLTKGALVGLLPAGAQLWLDGAHNDDAGRVLADWMTAQPGKFDAVIGMLSTKDAPRFLTRLKPHVARLRTVAVPGEAASISAEDLATIARAAGFTDVAPATDIDVALTALSAASRVMISGSLYLAGAVLARNA